MISRRIFGQMLASIGLAAPALAKQAQPIDQKPLPPMPHGINARGDIVFEPAKQSATFYTGQGGAPGEILGQSGDFYIDHPRGDIYQRVGGEWRFVQNLCGR